MAITSFADGSQTATLTTEHFLSSPNEAGTYVLYVDTNAMVAGDILELRVYKMTRASGTQRLLGPPAIFYDVQTSFIKISIPIVNELTDTNAIRFSLTQTHGTGRAYPWNVLKIA